MTTFQSIPYDRIVEFRDIQLFHNNIFQIHWILGRYCNYNCSYCWPASHSANRDEPKDESYFRDAVTNIVNNARQNGFENFHISLSGGEPTVHPHFFTVLDQLSSFKTENNAIVLVVVTNLSRGKSWLKQFVEKSKNLTYVTVVASWHREFASRDKFIESAKFLMENGINVSVNVTFSVNMFDEYYTDALYLQNAGLFVKALPQRVTNTHEYTQDQLNILQQSFTTAGLKRPGPLTPYPHGYVKSIPESSGCSMELVDDCGQTYYVDYPERFPSVGFTNFHNWLCYSGFQNICIDEFGDLRRGKAGCKDIVIGNIFSGGPYTYNTPMLCQKTRCDAATDSVTRKIKTSTSDSKNVLRKEIFLKQV